MAIAMFMGDYGAGSKPAPLPPMVTNLAVVAGSQTLTVSWTNPDSSRLAGVALVYNDKKPPENPYDGTRVDAKLAESVVLDGLVNGTEYFIRVFPYNSNMDYNTKPEGATISGTPADAPNAVTNVQVTGKGGNATITWENPVDPTLTEIVVMQTTGKPSTSMADGTEIYRGLEQTCTATGLEPNVDYCWTVYALNAAGKHKPPVASQAYSYQISKTLNDNSWEQISEVAKKGEGANYWHVGDAKAVEINGTVSGYTFSGTYYPFILGFNHNPTIEGKGIHFSFGKSALNGGKDVAFQGFQMNSSNTNAGGWKGSLMRTQTCSQFYEILPDELKFIIVECGKYTDNAGQESVGDSYITETKDKVFILSEFEVFGKPGQSNGAEKNKQAQYEYYKTGNPTFRYNSKQLSKSVWWWLRSPVYYGSNIFCIVKPDGKSTPDNASNEWFFSPCFMLGTPVA